MGLEQRIIKQKIENNEIITQCCITGLFKDSKGFYVGFHLDKPYNRISHGYSVESYQNAIYEVKNYEEINNRN